jgi:hypothetical protein
LPEMDIRESSKRKCQISYDNSSQKPNCPGLNHPGQSKQNPLTTTKLNAPSSKEAKYILMTQTRSMMTHESKWTSLHHTTTTLRLYCITQLPHKST